MKKTLISLAGAAALFGALAVPAYAASTFLLVVPLAARTQVQEPAEPITVSLAGAALPKATVSSPYSESLRSYLSVTGDSALDKSAARWRLVEGTLPVGLALDEATGAVSGTPTAKTASPASFTVLASYKGSDGQAIYTVEVGGTALNVSKLAAGSNHTCAILDSGSVKCWGANNVGQLGNNSTDLSFTPVDVVGLGAGVVKISAGDNHTCALMSSGAVKCWGLNEHGQLGDNSASNRSSPVEVVGLSSAVTDIIAGYSHTCALTMSGAASCWGFNAYGQLGDGSSSNTRLKPVAVVGLGSGVASLAAGTGHTCAVMESGAAKCWGHNVIGQLGDNSTVNRVTPVDVFGLNSGVVSISGGIYHTCAVMDSGSVKCWGQNTYGQLGDNSTTHRRTPVDVVGLEAGVTSLEAGSNHICVVMKAGGVKCWGRNYYGQLGDNSTTNKLTPVDVYGLTSGILAVTVGGNHNCAILSTGGIKCWGYNGSGQLGDHSATGRWTPVDAQDFQ